MMSDQNSPKPALETENRIEEILCNIGPRTVRIDKDRAACYHSTSLHKCIIPITQRDKPLQLSPRQRFHRLVAAVWVATDATPSQYAMNVFPRPRSPQPSISKGHNFIIETFWPVKPFLCPTSSTCNTRELSIA